MSVWTVADQIREDEQFDLEQGAYAPDDPDEIEFEADEEDDQ